jgi:ABC-2 type transport system permease protein
LKFSLGRLGKVVEGHIKGWYRNKSTMFWTLAFPLLLMLLFGGIFSLDDSTFDLSVQNQDLDDNGQPTQLSQFLLTALNSTTALNINYIDSKENSTQFIKDNEISRLLIIPDGFQKQAIQGNSSLILKLDQSQTASMTVSSILNGIVGVFNAELTGSPPIISIQQENVVSTNLRFIDFFMPGIIGMSIMATGLFGAIETNTKYRTNKVLRKLATTPLSKLEWILGMISYQMVLSFISTGIIILIGIIIFNIKVTLNFYLILLVISGALTFPGIGMVVARFVKDEEAANSAGNAIMFPMMFLSGTFFPIESMPSFIQPIANILPLTYLNNGLRDALILVRPESSLINTSIVLSIGLFFIILGIIVTSWRED